MVIFGFSGEAAQGGRKTIWPVKPE